MWGPIELWEQVRRAGGRVESDRGDGSKAAKTQRVWIERDGGGGGREEERGRGRKRGGARQQGICCWRNEFSRHIFSDIPKNNTDFIL